MLLGGLAVELPISSRINPNAKVASREKVRHLLSHAGGTGDIFGPGFEAHRLELKTLQDYVKLYGERDLQFEPGSKWEYSNYGFCSAC